MLFFSSNTTLTDSLSNVLCRHSTNSPCIFQPIHFQSNILLTKCLETEANSVATTQCNTNRPYYTSYRRSAEHTRVRKSGLRSNPKLLRETHRSSTSLCASGELSIMPYNLPYTLTPRTHAHTHKDVQYGIRENGGKTERGTETT